MMIEATAKEEKAMLKRKPSEPRGTEEEYDFLIRALEEKDLKKACCPRCGKNIYFIERNSSSAIWCEDEKCLKFVSRGI